MITGIEKKMSILEKTPEVAPLLVRFYDQHKLYSLAENKDPMARAELTTVMVDLLNVDLNPRQSELMTDVLIGLMQQAETDLRQALAERLSVLDDVPLRIVLHLANDDISVADKVLRDSKALHEMDLIYIIKSKGPEHWQSIAARSDLSGVVIDVLAETENVPTAIALTENDNISLTNKSVKIFTRMAKRSQRLAKPLLMRDEIPADFAKQLYEYVGRELKAHIKERFGAVVSPSQAKIIEEAADDIVIEFVEAKTREFEPTEKMLFAAEQEQFKHVLTVNRMIGNLQKGRIAYFIAELSVFSGLAWQTVHEIVLQENGQGLAIIAKAMGIPKSDFMSMFLLTYKARAAGSTIVNQAELTRAVHYFDKIPVDEARKILQQSRH